MYWDYYKNGGSMFQLPGNENGFNGCNEQDLYVERKFDSYKDEILHHINATIYHKSIVPKAAELMKSQKVKEMKAGSSFNIDADIDDVFHYGIKTGEPMTSNHVISLIMYCDLTEYCTEFSRSFRLLSKYETLQQAKKRNARFWFQSKYFREAVEIFGETGGGADGESGPFFSGCSVVLAIPQFSIRLRSPTSTSKQIAVYVYVDYFCV